MRHGVKKAKLQRSASHRKSLLANQACSLIICGRITTTLAKAKALRPYVEKLITKGKHGTLHARRLALAALPQPAAVKKLFTAVAIAVKDRQGGYTRIVKLGQRKTDSAPMAYIEIIDLPKEPKEVKRNKVNTTTGSATTTAEAAAAAIAAASASAPAPENTAEPPTEAPAQGQSTPEASAETPEQPAKSSEDENNPHPAE